MITTWPAGLKTIPIIIHQTRRRHLRFGHLHTHPASATHSVYNPAAQATNTNALNLYEPNSTATGSTSSAALSRSSSPLLRHSTSLSNSNIYAPTDHELVSLANKDGPPLQASQTDTDTEPKGLGQLHGDASYYLTAKLGNGPNTSVLENSTSLGPFNVASGSNNLNEDDLPLAKLLAIRRQEKIRQKTFDCCNKGNIIKPLLNIYIKLVVTKKE